MEIKARYMLVGAALLLAFAMFLALLIFSLNKGGGADLTYYRIEFKGGISGLSVGNDVRFNGIRVGEVRELHIDEADPSLVRAIVSVASSIPVREDSEASLEAQGLTGLSVIYISGGSAASPRLTAQEGQGLPLIRSRAQARLGDMLGSVDELLRRGSSLMSAENEENLRNLLTSLAALSLSLEQRSLELKEAIEGISSAGASLSAAMQTLDKALSQDGAPALASFRRASQRLEEILNSAGPGLTRLSTSGVDEVQRAANEAAQLFRSLNQLAQRINNDPQRFFFGDSVPSYK